MACDGRKVAFFRRGLRELCVVQMSNARMETRELKQYCELDEATKELLKLAMADLNLSARAYDRVLKVARTIAALAGSEKIASEHVSEAIQFRSLDRQLWT